MLHSRLVINTDKKAGFSGSSGYIFQGLGTKFCCCRPCIGRLKIRDNLDSVHASTAACMLASIGLCHHNSAVLRPVSELCDPPAKLTLHPIQGSCQLTVETLRQGSTKDLQTLMAAWIDAQSADNRPEVDL